MSQQVPRRSKPIYRDFDHEYRTAPPHHRPWLALCEVAPELRVFHDLYGIRQMRPPRPMSNGQFVTFAASLCDPVMRPALRKLLGNLLKPVIEDIIIDVMEQREKRWTERRF
jgi:hypothetical protein